jgi:ubiquitin carboxyl-terminal hydrolase 34
MTQSGDDAGTRISVESESDALSAIPPIETPSSSPSEPGSPQVELVAMNEEDSDFENGDPPLAIIGEDEVYTDPMMDFPYFTEGESLVAAVIKVARFLQYGMFTHSRASDHLTDTFIEEVTDADCFCKLRDWMDRYLRFTNDQDTFYEMYIKYREVWIRFPELVWALSNRRYDQHSRR